MENASKAMIMVGAVIITVLIISGALYLYSSSQGLLKTAGENIGDQEKQSFNQQWTYYDGEQTGDSVKDLLRKMMQNCSRNKEEQSRLVGLKIRDKTTDWLDVNIKVNATDHGWDENTTFYSIKGTSYPNLNPQDAKRVYAWVRNAIETRHVYYISQEYAANGLINKVIINYEK